MTDSQVKVRDVAWSELFPWLMLVRSVRIALMARVLILAAAGLIATMLGWALIHEVFSRSTDPVITAWPKSTSLRMWNDSTDAEFREIWLNTSAPNAMVVFDSARRYIIQAPIAIWQYITRPFVEMFQSGLSAIGFLFLLLCGIWELLVWGLFGGAISRIAALQFTRDEAPGILAALRHSGTKLFSYSLPPLIALAGASVFAIQLVVVGWLMHIDVLAFLMAIIWPFVIFLGLLMAILLLGALAGWPLMWSTVSVEGTDAFDALSRSYAYTYHRPWRLLWYVLFAFFLAIVSMFIVKLFATSAIKLGNWSIERGLDTYTMTRVVSPETTVEAPPVPPPAPPAPSDDAQAESDAVVDEPDAATAAPAELSRPLSWARWTIDKWKSLVATLVAGYQVAFLFVSAVGVYLLLRRDIDGVQINEVYIDQTEEYGMPPLAEDIGTGVPEVALSGPAPPSDMGTA